MQKRSEIRFYTRCAAHVLLHRFEAACMHPEVPENKTVNCTGTAASSIRVPYYSAAAMMALVAAAVARRRGYIRLPFQDSPSRQH